MDANGYMLPAESTEGRQLARIEAKLDQLLAPPLSPLVNPKEAMALTGTNSARALHRELGRLGVHRVGRAKWRRQDITSAQARKILESQTKAKGKHPCPSS